MPFKRMKTFFLQKILLYFLFFLNLKNVNFIFKFNFKFEFTFLEFKNLREETSKLNRKGHFEEIQSIDTHSTTNWPPSSFSKKFSKKPISYIVKSYYFSRIPRYICYNLISKNFTLRTVIFGQWQSEDIINWQVSVIKLRIWAFWENDYPSI